MKIFIRRCSLDFGPYSREGVTRYLNQGKLSLEDLAWSGNLTGLEEWIPLTDLLTQLDKEDQGETSGAGEQGRILKFVDKIKDLVAKGESELAKDHAISLGTQYPTFLGELLKQCCMDEDGNFYLPPWIRTHDGTHDETLFLLSILPHCEDAMGLDESLRIDRIKALNLETFKADISLLASYPSLESLSIHSAELEDLKELEILPCLKSLKLFDADKLEEITELKHFPDLQDLELNYLDNLEYLRVCDHPSLKSFELNTYGWESKIEELWIQDCPQLERLNIDIKEIGEDPVICNLPNLTHFQFHAWDGFQCFTLENCPCLIDLIVGGDALARISGLEDLHHLETFELTGCSESGFFSLSFKGCKALEWLDLNCDSVKQLNLSGCNQLNRFFPPDDMTKLNLSGCETLEELDIRYQRDLSFLDLSGCSGMHELFLPYTPHQLEDLKIVGCDSLLEIGISLSDSINDLSFLSECPNLNELSIMGMDVFEDLSFLPPLSELETLSLIDCHDLQNLDGLSAVADSLDSLAMSCLDQLEQLDLNTGFPQLSRFHIQASKLENLNFLSQMPNLLELNIDCESLQDSKGLKNLNQLERLEITVLPDDSLDAFGRNSNLIELLVYNCAELDRIPELSNFPELEILFLQNCDNITDLKPLGSLSKLRTLDLYLQENCEYLDFSTLGKLFNLRELTLCSKKLFEIAWIVNLKNLSELSLNGCEMLEDLRGLSALSNLTSLNLGVCPSLVDLDELSSLSELRELYLYECSGLEWISGIESLIKLEVIELQGCEMITEEQVRELESKLPNCYIYHDF